MRVVVCVPHHGDGAERTRNWAFVREHIDTYYPYPIVVGDDIAPGTARNRAAAQAGNWDVAIFHDSDNLAHPDAVKAAVRQASERPQMVIAGDCHLYLSAASSQRIVQGEPWFCRPYDITVSRGPDHGCQKAFWARPCSGVYAISRDLWDRTGGFIESMGVHGKEDLVFLQTTCIWGEGNAYIDEHVILHLWHKPGRHATHPDSVEARRNTQLWQQLSRIRGPKAQAQAAALLAGYGHTVPDPDFLSEQAAEWDRYTASQAGQESVCGPGSTLEFTEALRAWLPTLLKRYQVSSIIDAPCGDANWMSHTTIGRRPYLGLDVQQTLIQRNRVRDPGRRFEHLNLLTATEIPHADLIICRDFFAHIPQPQIQHVLALFRRSGAHYLLATNFPLNTNSDARMRDANGFTYRPVKLNASPYDLPTPIETLDEPGPEKGRQMALFKLQS